VGLGWIADNTPRGGAWLQTGIREVSPRGARPTQDLTAIFPDNSWAIRQEFRGDDKVGCANKPARVGVVKRMVGRRQAPGPITTTPHVVRHSSKGM